jgi:hypothetical protein
MVLDPDEGQRQADMQRTTQRTTKTLESKRKAEGEREGGSIAHYSAFWGPQDPDTS